MQAFMVLCGMRFGDYILVDRVSRQCAALFLISLLACYLLDRIALIPARLRGRYQIIHCLGNIVVAGLAWEDAANAFVHPSSALHGDSDLSPYIVALAIHVYHVLAFRPLTHEEWKHHLLMVFVPLPIVIWFRAGRLSSLSVFAACGAPGAICYGAIGLRKNGVLSRLTEKRINAAVNTWFRSPLVTIAGYVVFVAIWDHPTRTFGRTPAAMGTSIAILMFWNGQFYGRQVVENYGCCRMEFDDGRRSVPPPTVC